MKLFVYGTLRRGFPNNYLLGESFVEEAELPGYDLFVSSYAPAIKQGGGTVKGEVYDVSDPELWRVLDSLEGVDRGVYKKVLLGALSEDKVYECIIYEGGTVFDFESFTKVESGDYKQYKQEQQTKYLI